MNAILINSLADGGAEKVALTVIKALVDRDHQIKLICLEKNQYYSIPDGVEVIYLSSATGDENNLIKLLRLPQLAMKLSKCIHQYKIKIVQSHLFRANYTNILAKILGSNHLSQLVNTGSITAKYARSGFSGKVNLLLIKLLYPQADCLIDKSQGVQNDMNEKFGFNVPKHVIYNPIHVEFIQSKQKDALMPHEFHFQSQRRYIITMARMHPQKCFDILIHSFASIANKFKDTDLVILGDGIEKQNIIRLIAELGLNHRIFLTGRVENPYKYLIRSHLFILPSATEGFPNSLVEAMFCKLPVISTDCMSGPREILAPESDVTYQIQNNIEFAPYGVLVPVKNKALLSEAMVQLLENHSLAQQYAEKGHLRACMFSMDSIINQYETLFACN
ncbi:MAG: glycosyltransferase [Candidatus Magnetoglobus multicellularis str. Araruama]|uniref:Glycosyltransferase n=1 Tax=Candidatus Magnetoglobus multicellularis str. Araruama TaxID=890399 RepID=A0A1V1PH95_9BACT|nr:MAG: glycosyltransferase [Candidatus Magnetoglobus multicellularis str. Araruama]